LRELDRDMVKILSFNLWNYENYNERKPKIIGFIKKQDPDLVVFQEIRDDALYNKKGENQLKNLNRELGYPHELFYPVTDKRKERPEKYRCRCIEGTGVLSKYPLKKIETKKLEKQPEDRYTCGNIHVRVQIGKKAVDLVAVHFSNSDLYSLLHLIETMSWVRKKKITPIIAGDFNMRHPKWLGEITGEEYKNSYQYKKYISYPRAKFTLDYIVIPKKYFFKKVECKHLNLSDHKPLLAEVKL